MTNPRRTHTNGLGRQNSTAKATWRPGLLRVIQRHGGRLVAGAEAPHIPVSFPMRFQEGSGAVARGVSVAKRRVPQWATARTALPFRTEPIRREQPSTTCAPKRLVRTCAPAKRPQLMPSGETAPSSASTGIRWGCGGSCVCWRARSTGACMAPIRGKCIMHEERRWFVGIDWASQEHVVSLCDGQGKKMGQRKFAHGGTGFSDMIAWLLKTSGGEPGLSEVLCMRLL